LIFQLRSVAGLFRLFFFFFQAEDGIRDFHVTGVQTCALPILAVALLQRGAWRGPTLLLAPAVAALGLAPQLPEGVPVTIVHGVEIGRASCRERVERSVGAAEGEEKRERGVTREGKR